MRLHRERDHHPFLALSNHLLTYLLALLYGLALALFLLLL